MFDQMAIYVCSFKISCVLFRQLQVSPTHFYYRYGISYTPTLDLILLLIKFLIVFEELKTVLISRWFKVFFQ